MTTLLVIIYVLSVLICGAGGIYLLREELASDRRKLERLWENYELSVTWLNILGGTLLVFVPFFNSMIAGAIIASLLDRPVLSKRKNS